MVFHGMSMCFSPIPTKHPHHAVSLQTLTVIPLYRHAKPLSVRDDGVLAAFVHVFEDGILPLFAFPCSSSATIS